MRTTVAVFLSLILAGCATAGETPHGALAPGAKYVAMGSSYAAGAGIGATVPGTPERCGRTVNNYAHLLAARLRLDLADVSCGGATTANVLGRWNELPPQIDAVTPDTRLVTVTIGGNDVNFIRNLMVAMCGSGGMMPPPGRSCPAPAYPAETEWQGLEQRMRQIAREVHRRAPQARLVFVDYVRLFPDSGSCAALPIAAQDLGASRKVFRRLAEITAKVAREEGAELLPAGELSRGREACSPEPWGRGYPATDSAAWHPTAAAHAGIADALAARLAG